MNTNENSGVLMRRHEYSWIWCPEYSWVLMTAYEGSQKLMFAYGTMVSCSWVLMAHHNYSMIWKKIWVWNKFLVWKVLGSKKFGLKKLCLKTFWSQNTLTPKKVVTKSLVKIEAVTAETLLMWKNVARAYVALTNVTLRVVSLSKSDQEQLRYSWYGQMSPGQRLPGQMSVR